MSEHTVTLMDYEPYRAAKAKEAELLAERDAVGRSIDDITSQLRAPGRSLEFEAAALLQNESLQSRDNETLQESLAELYHRREVLSVAIEMQKREIGRQKEAASKRICEHFGPRWQEMAKAIRDGARSLAKVGQAEWEFRQNLIRSGIAMLPPLTNAAGMTESLLHQLTFLADTIERWEKEVSKI
jgi:hypothetical protein